jgi:F-type H+-transporting ATPase subunit b
MLQEPEFWVTVAFFAFVAVAIYLKLPGLINRALDNQAARIRSELDHAARLHRDAQALVTEYQQKKQQVLVEAEQIVAHAKQEAERLAREAEAELTASLERRRALAEAKIARAEAQALKEVRETAVDVAVAAAARLLADQVKGAKGDALVDTAISSLGAKLH